MSTSMASQCACGAPVEPGARFCGSCGGAVTAAPVAMGQTQPATAPDSMGRTIAGRYRLIAKLGEGGMGAVFRAEQLSLKREVALKVLRPELSADPGLVRRFNAEAEAAARLNHPNTITVYDFGQDTDGSLFIAMELVPGKSLRAEVAGGPMTAARTIAIAEQVCASLADAHAHGVVHRDLKPDNVMLTERGRERDIVRVLDFGIAKLRDVQGDMTAMPMTQSGDLIGTPQYMAPEQIKGDKVDGRTDVYALGAMLYEMVTGQMVFVAPTLMGVLSKHLSEPPAPPSQRRPDVAIPPALAAVIMNALEKPMDKRPQSMDELRDRLLEVGGVLGWQGGAAPGAVTPPRSHAAGSLGAVHGAGVTPARGQIPGPGGAGGPISGPASAPVAAAPSPAPGAPQPHSQPAARRSRIGLVIAAMALVVVGIGVGAFFALSGDEDVAATGEQTEPTQPEPGPTPTPAVPNRLPADFSVEPEREIYAQEPNAERIRVTPAPPQRTGEPGFVAEEPASGGFDLVRARSQAGVSIRCPRTLDVTHTASGLACTGWLGDGVMMVVVNMYPPTMVEQDLLTTAKDAAELVGQTVVGSRWIRIAGKRQQTLITRAGELRYEMALVISKGRPVMVMMGGSSQTFSRTADLRRAVLGSVRAE